jgi:hypothetical protein
VDTALENITPDDDLIGEIYQPQLIPIYKNDPIPERKSDPFLNLKRFYYRIESYLSLIFIAIGFGSLFVNEMFHRPQPAEVHADSLGLFFMFFFWGLAGLVFYLQGKDSDSSNFNSFALKAWISLIFFWGFAIFILYKILTP